jgi:hypothetical protein
MTGLTRRDFIKLGGAAFAVSILPHGLARAEARLNVPPASLGRIAAGWRQPVRKEAKVAADIVSYKSYDDIIPLYAQVEGEAPWPTNPIWYQTDDGYIHSAYVQPVENTPSGNILRAIASPGVWLQVCVPIAGARTRVDSQFISRKLYYGTVYRGIEVVQDAAGEWWYRLQDGIAYAPGPYVPAWAMRYLSPADLSPLTSRDEKYIEVHLTDQVLTCYEGDRAVFTTRTATGYGSNFTPRGEYRVIRKRFTSYMIGGEGSDYYNLPGVAFPTYFTASAIAVHGTYWHNDFGRPKSHGCVNVNNDAARFVFRWTEPAMDYADASLSVKKGEGTLVKVI